MARAGGGGGDGWLEGETTAGGPVGWIDGLDCGSAIVGIGVPGADCGGAGCAGRVGSERAGEDGEGATPADGDSSWRPG